MDILNILILTVLILIGFIFLDKLKSIRKEPKKFPKGPRSFLPLIGGLAPLGKEPHKVFLELRKKWGNIFAYDLGPQRVVVLNNYEVIRDALSRIEFNGKTNTRVFLLKQADEKPHGILWNQGKVWMDQRRFTLKNLRDFGFGKGSVMEKLLDIEITELIETFKKTCGEKVLIHNHFNISVLNALWSIIAGYRFEQNNTQLLDLMNRITEDIKIILVLNFFPWFFKIADYFPSFLGGKVAKYMQNSRFTLEFMRKEIEAHKKTYEENSERDFIDRYLTEIGNSKNEPNSSFHGIEGEKNLTTVVHDLFIAGAETTSTTLSWAVHLLSLNPEIQEKLHEEIKNVIGLNRNPTLADKLELPYTEAVICEILRYSTIIPALRHETMENITNFHGYDIPKGTLIIVNLYACLQDPLVWANPQIFKPSRFLSEDEKTLLRPHDAFIPFSTAKRQCLGEKLARDTLFLFMVSIFQRFQILPLEIPPSIDTFYGVTNGPVSFPLHFIDRLEKL